MLSSRPFVVLTVALIASGTASAAPDTPHAVDEAVAKSDTPSDVAVDERIARGKAAIDALEYETAAEELTIAAIDARATHAQRVEANLFAGIAHRILRRDVDAKLNFVFVLKHVPDARLPAGTTPKIRNFFELIRQEVELSRVRHHVEPARAPPVAVAAPPPPAEVEAPPAREPKEVEPSSGVPLGVFAAGLAGLGILAIVGGATTIALTDAMLGDPSLDGSQKELAVYGFFGGAGVVAAGLAVGITGGFLAVGALE